jgi:hypothetical protein
MASLWTRTNNNTVVIREQNLIRLQVFFLSFSFNQGKGELSAHRDLWPPKKEKERKHVEVLVHCQK